MKKISPGNQLLHPGNGILLQQCFVCRNNPYLSHRPPEQRNVKHSSSLVCPSVHSDLVVSSGFVGIVVGGRVVGTIVVGGRVVGTIVVVVS